VPDQKPINNSNSFFTHEFLLSFALFWDMCHNLISSNLHKLKKNTFPSFREGDQLLVPDRLLVFLPY